MFAVEFKDSLHGWCEAGGLIYRTVDGGFTWLSSSGQPVAASAISMSDTLNGWAVGSAFRDEGVILRTTNGGVTWIEQRHDYFRNYYGTSSLSILRNFTSGNTYYSPVARDTGKTLQTLNGGQLWTEKTHADSIIALRKIQFVDSLHGWMDGAVHDQSGYFGYRSVFFRTTDAGSSWLLIDKPVGFFSFVDTLHGFADGGRNYHGDGFYLLRTEDGGLSWDSVLVLYASVYNDQITFEAISFVDTLNGWMFGYTFYQGGLSAIIIRTSDAGKSWALESIGLADDVGDAVMIDKYHGWAVTLDGKVLGYGLLTGIAPEHLREIPKGFSLRQNYPNPFNNYTVIEYEISKESDVQIVVYDETGELVRTLVDQHQSIGVYRVQFDATSLSSGVYYYKIEAGSYRETKQLILLK